MTYKIATKAQLKRFRTIGHKLKPIVTIAGNGVSEAVINELNRAINDHELIKIRVNADDRDDRKNTISQISTLSETEVVQTIGNVALLYKPAKKPNPKLSNILRAEVL